MIIIGQYHRIKCPICMASILLDTGDAVTTCPACKEYIGDQLNRSGDGTGINTATASGPGLKPLGGVINDVY